MPYYEYLCLLAQLFVSCPMIYQLFPITAIYYAWYLEYFDLDYLFYIYVNILVHCNYDCQNQRSITRLQWFYRIGVKGKKVILIFRASKTTFVDINSSFLCWFSKTSPKPSSLYFSKSLLPSSTDCTWTLLQKKIRETSHHQ